MRNIGLFVIAVTAVLSLAAQASAQKMMGAMPKQFLLLNPKVQTELKLTDAQKQTIDKAVKDVVSSDGEGRIRIQMGPGTDMDSIVKDLKKAINDAQDKRLTEIWMQRDGSMVLTDAEVAKDLGLTAEQKKKVAGIIEDMMEEMKEIAMSNGGRIEAHHSKDLRDGTKKKLDGVMTAAQKTKFEAMKGKPFKI